MKTLIPLILLACLLGGCEKEVLGYKEGLRDGIVQEQQRHYYNFNFRYAVSPPWNSIEDTVIIHAKADTIFNDTAMIIYSTSINFAVTVTADTTCLLLVECEKP